MSDPKIRIIDASGAGPLDWPIVAEEFHQAQQEGVPGILLKIPDNADRTPITNYINIYSVGRRMGLDAERVSAMIDADTFSRRAKATMKFHRDFFEEFRARPGATSRGGDRG